MTSCLLRFNIQPVPSNQTVFVSEDGEVFRRKPGTKNVLHRLNGYVGKVGYRVISLNRGGKGTVQYVHGMVAETFLGKRPDGACVRHLNGDKLNNKVSNLRWGTVKENADDRWMHGTMIYGEGSSRAKLTAVEVLEIRELGRRGMTKVAIAKRFGVDRRHVGNILAGNDWKWLQDDPVSTDQRRE